ncbi:hypothetical protein [Microlunatus antarcticus]|uniref:Uncharacterized protein n=1 Tax=Microlunatus antarcticus TaxID=53388 RepID=A0A7W5P6I3_9ACTN|nr:hypothetical protein [Microlunatus antarcticus]MBB3326468.1 hypothetical protein [Microlunatus antarcticus]
MARTRAQQRQRTSRRSTFAGLGGIAMIALGVVLTLAHVAGNIIPTILALLGMGTLIAGISTGTLLVLENFRYRRDQSYYDDDEN